METISQFFITMSWPLLLLYLLPLTITRMDELPVALMVNLFPLNCCWAKLPIVSAVAIKIVKIDFIICFLLCITFFKCHAIVP